ncbi:hypothetical protein [Mycolicibacterium houstonense]|uniref:hypothetical protein n=1 Tax=Mycolicibacterium houstonense TaxID=146021 RepID=UPI00082E6782|nr:hypothetical protein [Mycolicibacterium houstonense]
MDTEKFLDELYQGFAKTTGAEDRFWVVEPDEETTGVKVYAMGQDGTKKFVGFFLTELDGDFAASLHGAVPDLVRVTRTALDDAERLSLDRDQQEGRIADLELEILGLKNALGER